MNGWQLYPLRVLWVIVGLPFSAALDTVCLPYDVLSWYSYYGPGPTAESPKDPAPPSGRRDWGR